MPDTKRANDITAPAQRHPAAVRQRPHLAALLFADFFNRTEDGKYNLSGIFGRIRTPAAHPMTPRFALYIRVENIDATEPLQFTIYGPDGEVGIDGTILLAEDLAQAGVTEFEVATWLQFPPPAEGRYWFEIAYRGEGLGGAALMIQFQPQEGANDADDSRD